MLSFAYKRFDGRVPEPGDRERAAELLREAQAAFEEMGAPRYAAVARERLQELRAAEGTATGQTPEP